MSLLTDFVARFTNLRFRINYREVDALFNLPNNWSRCLGTSVWLIVLEWSKRDLSNVSGSFYPSGCGWHFARLSLSSSLTHFEISIKLSWNNHTDVVFVFFFLFIGKIWQKLESNPWKLRTSMFNSKRRARMSCFSFFSLLSFCKDILTLFFFFIFVSSSVAFFLH